MELEQIARNIEKRENGIYFSRTSSKISYPKDGNEKCLQLESDSFWFNHRNDAIVTSVKKYSPHEIFFDVGGGNGFVSKGIQDEGIDVVLIEPGINGCINARNRNIDKVVCSTLENVEFEKSSIGSVGLLDVVEHIEDDHKFLLDIHSYIKPGGYVFITVPAYNFLWSNEDVHAGHFRRYSLSQLNKLLASAGFRIEYSTYIFSILPVPIFLFRSIPSKVGLGKGFNKQSKHKKEHSNRKGVLKYLLQRIWSWEIRKITASQKISFGGSCLAVGKKTA